MLVSGLVLTTIGLVLFTQISADGSYVGDVLVPSVIVAVGLGLSFVSLTITAVSGVTHHDAGMASGLLNTAQQVGGAFPMARNLGLRLVAEPAHVDGWGDPVTWLRNAEEYFHRNNVTGTASACRALLRQVGVSYDTVR